MSRSVQFSDSQLRMLRETAKAVPLQYRGDFHLIVARRLAGAPSDAAVMQAINHALDQIHLEQSHGCC